MSTMLAVDEELAATLRTALPGKVIRLDLDLDGVPLRWLEDEGPRALAEDVARKAPDVLVTGVKLGGNAWCGMEGVRRVLRAPTPPAVLVLTPVLTQELAAHGRALGVYGFIGTRGRSVVELVTELREAVSLAASSREVFSRLAEAPGRRARPSVPSKMRRGPRRAKG